MMTRQSVDPRAPRRPHAKGLLWLGWAVSASGLLALSGALFSEALTFADVRRYQGYFDPAVTRQPLTVPADVPLAAVLVREGEDVVQGQRVALFDSAQLKARITFLQEEFALNRLERDCLMRGSTSADRDTSAIAGNDDFKLRAKTVLNRCALRHKENALVVSELVQGRNALHLRAQLAHREALERARLTAPSVRRVLSLRAAIERGELDAAIARLEFDLAAEATRQAGQIQDEVAKLEAKSHQLRRKIQFLQSYAEAPYLVAPDSGKVIRVRNLPLHEAFSSETTLVHLEAETPEVFEATLIVPLDEVALVDSSRKILVHLAGLPPAVSSVPAHITGTTRSPVLADGQQVATVNIALDLSDTEPNGGLNGADLLKNSSGRSAITATFSNTTLSSAILPAWSRLGSHF